MSPVSINNNIYSAFESNIQKNNNKVAFEYYTKGSIERVTFGCLFDRIEIAVEHFRRIGLNEGDRVAIMLGTSPNWAVIFVALMRLRLTAVLIDPALPHDNIIDILKFSDVSCIVSSSKLIFDNIDSEFRRIPVILVDSPFNMADKNNENITIAHSGDGDTETAVIIFTSGTSGKYKAVMITHMNILNILYNKFLTSRAKNFFSIMPLYHVAGLLVFLQGTLYLGKTASYIETPDPELILRVFKQSQPVNFFGIPRFLELFYIKINNQINEKSYFTRFIIKYLINFCGFMKQKTKFNLGKILFYKINRVFGRNLKLFFIGGAPLNPKIQQFFESIGFDVMIGYGLSETTGSTIMTDVFNKKMGALGKPYEGAFVRIDSPDENGIGEICIKSPSIMKGYFRNDSETKKSIQNSWFHTGDLGHIDSEGNVYIDGRIKDIIVTASGKKSTPHEIEAHYQQIPGVSELAVVGIRNPSEYADEIYAAIVVEDNNRDPALRNQIKNTISSMAGLLPSQYRIQHIEFFDSLPQTSGMKKIIRPKLVAEIQNRKKLVGEPSVEPNLDTINNELMQVTKTIISVVSIVTSVDETKISSTHHFSDHGVDSLLALEIIQKLRSKYDEKIISADNLLKNPTIIEYSKSILDNMRNPQTVVCASLCIVPPRIIPTSAPLAVPMSSVVKSDVIFLTGGTGVLGGYFTKLLLAETGSIIYLLTRAKSDDHAKKKLIEILRVYDAPVDLIAQIEKRVHFVLGDVAQPYLGLPPEEYSSLPNKIDLVIHAAASTSLHGIYNTLVPINLLGTKTMIDFTLKTKQKYMVYVSTYSIMGSLLLEKSPLFTEHDFDKGQSFDHMGYQQTKFESELLVRGASSEGLKWNILRPGDIFGDSQNGSYPLLLPQLGGVFYDILRTVIDTKVAVNSLTYFDMTPVDYVARGMLYLSLKYPALYGTYHLTNPDAQPYVHIIKCIQDVGYPIDIISLDDYVDRLQNNKLLYNGKPYRSKTLELLQFNPTMASTNENTHTSTKITQSILEPVGIFCPPIDKNLIKIYLDYCKKVGFLKQ